jgi:hypothetical protein
MWMEVTRASNVEVFLEDVALFAASVPPGQLELELVQS